MKTIFTPRQVVRAARAGIALAILLVAPFQSFNGWTQTTPTAPSQTPLITRQAQPSPNVMVTLDTSWSMIFPYLPEGAFSVNNTTVKFPGFDSPIMHPSDTRYAKTAQNHQQQPPLRSDGNGGAIPADLTDLGNVFQRQMRSPDVNQLYYNPRLRYQPWLKSKDVSANTEERYPPADPKKALFDPRWLLEPANATPTSHADLTATASEVSAVWCEKNPVNAGGKLACGNTNGLAYNKSFSPAVYFLLNSKANPTVVGSYTVYDINNPTSDKQFIKYAKRSDCVSLKDYCTKKEELQNYANWFVYYRTRLHIAQAAIPESFLQLDDNKIRVGWGTIHQGESTIDGASTRIVQSGVREMDSDRKGALVKWIRNFRGVESIPDTSSPKQPELAGGTPLLGALTGVGEYFSRTDERSPWAANPALKATVPAPLACRRSYNMLITDGYYTDESTVGNEDKDRGVSIPNHIANAQPTSYTYAGNRPFSDDKAGKLADVAMKYWKNDLQPSIQNKVPYGNDTLLEDPAFWQHLVQFPIGLGVSGNIPLSDLNNQLAQIKAETKGWWDGDASAAKIDDLLHAAINSRGQYFSAKDSSELVSALNTALGRASENPGLKEGGVGVATTVLGTTNNVKYVPEYTSGSWSGDVKAYALNDKGVAATAPRWSAAAQLPAFGRRNIVTWSGTAGTDFTWESLPQASKDLITPTLPEGASGDQLINYIKGDASNEDSNGTIGLFRKRTGKLADFINSNPLLIKGNLNSGYQQLPTDTPGQSTYSAFVLAKAARPTVVFVGGNGGMLHAFADYTVTGAVVPGQEIFAYVPKTVHPNLSALALRNYGKAHRYYVDGPLAEVDAHLRGGWKNILLGTLGAGGKALFALDVSDATAMRASSILWEKSSADEADMGYMLSAPQAGILPNGDWAVFVGNGVHSSNGKAALLVINLSTGTMSKVVVEEASGSNGLGGVTLVKNGNQQVIGAYAGDLKGNVWRFTVTNTGTAFKKLFTASPPGTAATVQPITAQPAVMAHPKGGYLVVVGTGKLFDAGDNDDLSRQSVYGLWDKPTTSGDSIFDGVTNPRGKLVQQTIGSAVTDNGGVYYTLSSNPVDYNNPNVLGWYIDLTNETGQRLIYAPRIIRDYVFLDTMAPAKAAVFCDASNGNSYNYLVPILTGNQLQVRIFDTNGDGLINSADTIVAGYSGPADGGDAILTRPNEEGGTDCSIQNTGNAQNCRLPPPPPTETGGKPIRGRVWRQIMNPPHP